MFDGEPEERGSGGDKGDADCGVFVRWNRTRIYYCAQCLGCLKQYAEEELELPWDLCIPKVKDISGCEGNMGFNYRLELQLPREAVRLLLDVEETVQAAFFEALEEALEEAEEPEPDE